MKKWVGIEITFSDEEWQARKDTLKDKGFCWHGYKDINSGKWIITLLSIIDLDAFTFENA